MFKRSLWIALGLVALVVFFTVMPTGTNASDVLDGYQNTLSLTRSGTLPYQFMDVIEAKDPLLVEVENKAGSHVDYLWVTDDGTPITTQVVGRGIMGPTLLRAQEMTSAYGR